MSTLNVYRVAAILALCPFVAVAQSSFNPEPFGPEVNTSYDEINPVVSSDENTLFFTRVNHPENKYGRRDSEDIWVSHRVNGNWSPAVRVEQLNIGRYNSVLNLSEDGKTLLLNGVYNRKGNIWKKRGLSVSVKEGDMWGTPEKLKVKKLSRKNKGLKMSASMSADESLVLSFSKTHNGKKTNLFISRRKKNKWTRPVPIRALNTRFNEETPFLSTDGLTIYFTSDRRGKGMFDIYISTRSDTSSKEWSDPVLLQEPINTDAWDAYFKTDAKGCRAYFSSTRNPEGRADIFHVRLSEECPESAKGDSGRYSR